MTIEDQTRQRWAPLTGAGGAQDRTPGEPVAADLPAPGGVSATAGRGQVTVSWAPVPGAIGYAVHRSPSPEGPFEVVDHGGGDVLAVPHGLYADTTPGRGGWYAVAALQTANAIGLLSDPVLATDQRRPAPVGRNVPPESTGRAPPSLSTGRGNPAGSAGRHPR